jgi:hypothetical protein
LRLAINKNNAYLTGSFSYRKTVNRTLKCKSICMTNCTAKCGAFGIL